MMNDEYRALKEISKTLNAIAKELNKIDKKLGQMSQASIFHPPNTVVIKDDGIRVFNNKTVAVDCQDSQEKQSI